VIVIIIRAYKAEIARQIVEGAESDLPITKMLNSRHKSVVFIDNKCLKQIV